VKGWLRRALSVEWLPTMAVLLLILVAGSRLIYLSVQQHAAGAREAAVAVAAAYAGKIEPVLRALADAADQQAAAASRSTVRRDAVATSAPLAAAHAFLMTSDDEVQDARGAPAALASGVAQEWRSAETHATPGAALLGPIRIGSQWFFAVRAPLAQSKGWAVAYAPVDELLAAGRVSALIDQGYDFELSQFEPRSARARIFSSSSAVPLTDTIDARLRLPAPAVIPQSYLTLAIRLRGGWYPVTLLTSEVALLGFLAWLLAFGTHDLGHALRRSSDALAAARRRLHSTNQRLAAEMRERVTLQQNFEHARFHDAFTGLPNRRYFMDQVDRALRDVRTRQRQRIAVILIDIARFKLVNDMLGHTAGDELMVQAARRFEKSVAISEGILARWGGDQFAVLLLDVSSAEAALLAAGALQEEIRAPIELRRHRLVVSAALGVTCVDSGQRRAEDVVREADLALSAAKRHPTDKLALYAPTMAGQAASLVSLEADLHVAIEKHELRLLFQPIVDFHTHRMVAAEALLRWRHPIEGVLGPDKFLSIAEDAGLMVSLTRWVILRAVRVAGEWQRRLPANVEFFITVNLSPTALRDSGLSEFVGSLLRQAQLAPSLLKFELTEASLIGNVGAARETLEQLHAMGIQLMLDDFGTGYSSLNNLQLFPFDYVKIDRPFANHPGSDQANAGMMAALVQMAGSLHLKAIAEIVETPAAARALENMGCDYGQGYYFSKPIDAELALQRLMSQEPFDRAPAPDHTVELPAITGDIESTQVMSADLIRFPPERELP
jgi:diguanylate cyclase (GGDEF)-like protein